MRRAVVFGVTSEEIFALRPPNYVSFFQYPNWERLAARQRRAVQSREDSTESDTQLVKIRFTTRYIRFSTLNLYLEPVTDVYSYTLHPYATRFGQTYKASNARGRNIPMQIQKKQILPTNPHLLTTPLALTATLVLARLGFNSVAT